LRPPPDVRMFPTNPGVAQLERLRASLVGEAGRAPVPLSPQEFVVTKAVLDCLGVGLEPTHQFIMRERASLAELEAWVMAQVGGTIDQGRIARANAIVCGDPPDARRLKELEQLRRAPSVLSGPEISFWEENGYVIVRDAAPRAACRELELAIWRHLRADPEDPESWYRCELHQGVMVQLFDAPGIAEIHASPRIHKAFSQLAGTVDLVMTADRCGFNPPVRRGHPYAGARLHHDLSSFQRPVSPDLQGILYLTDTAEDQGALRLIPGFHKRIDSWLESLPEGRDPTLEDLETLGSAESIAAAAGDLIIWSSALPHGPQANTADRPRIVHYLTMYPTPQRGTTPPQTPVA
jgi:Phytanoyl-CoA dioxygenase (PhyH)